MEETPKPSPVLRFAWLWVFLAALIVRLAHVWFIHDDALASLLLGDAHSYDAWAQRIAGGDWLGDTVFYQAPLYPYFLGVIYAIFGHSLLAVRLAQVIVGAAGCAMLGEAGRRFFSPVVGLIAGLMMAVYPPAVFSDAILQKSVLDLFLLALVLMLCGMMQHQPHWWKALCIGGATAALMLVRENAAALVPILLVWVVLLLRANMRKAMLAGGAIIAGLIIVLSPVVVRNGAISGELHITTSQFGPNFYIGNNPAADGQYAPLRYGRGHPSFESADARELAEEALGRELSPGEVSDYWSQQAFAYIRSDFAGWLRLTGRKTMLLLNAVELGDTEDQYTYEMSSPVLAWPGTVWHFGVLLPLAMAGVVLTARQWRQLALLYAITLVYAASVVAFFIFARYRLPLAPPLMLFASAALVHAWKLAGDGKGLRLIAPAVVAVIAAIIANWPLLSVATVKAVSANNIANALLEQRNDPVAAMTQYERAIQLQPSYSGAYFNLAQLQAQRGLVLPAIRNYLKVIEQKPDLAAAHLNVGELYARVGRPEEARQAYGKAIALQPINPEAYNNLGVLYAGAGQFDDAIAQYRIALQQRPGYADAMNNMGTSLARLGQLDAAIAQFRAAIAANPRYANAYDNLGLGLSMKQQWRDAVAAYQKVTELHPDDPVAWLMLADTLRTSGDAAGAMRAARQGLDVANRVGAADVAGELTQLITAMNGG